MTLTFCLGLAGQVTGQDQPGTRTLVTIDDFAVTDLHFALFANQTGRNPKDGQEQLNMLNELATHFMIANSAEGQALAGQAEVNAALEVARARLIAQSFINSRLQQTPIEEEELRALYAAQYGDAQQMEYKARHILLKTEDEAKAIIMELDGGADFATLAKERSIGPSKTAGGDLGWFEAKQMVSEFAAATANLDNGAYSRSPVQTQFGWHVILREDSRELPPPTFESARPELEKQVQREHVAKAIAEIKENTRIEVQSPEPK
jgi:peptidyl-prolyl cis-trans isomerase C